MEIKNLIKNRHDTLIENIHVKNSFSYLGNGNLSDILKSNVKR
jgi:hypothetical protein